MTAGSLGRLAALVSLLTMALLGPASAQGEIRLKIGLIPTLDVTPVVAGIKKGYFTQEGLDIEIVKTVGGATAVPALMSGAWGIAYGNVVSSLLAAQQGLDIKVIGVALAGGVDYTPLISRKADGFKSGKDLQGKVVGVNTRNNVIWLFARAWVEATGGDPAKVNFKEVPFPQMGDALKQKQIDAAFIVEPFASKLLADPELEMLALPYKVVQPGLQIGNYIVAGKYLDQNKATVDKFLRAMKKSNDWFDQNLKSAELNQIIAEFTGVPLATVETLPKSTAFSGISVEEMLKTREIMRKSGILTKDVDVAKLVYRLAN